MKPIKIIGAGVSGLVTAYYLRQQGFEVEVYETAPQIGGLISTHRLEWGLVETAANGMINSSLIEDLFSDLGISSATPAPERKKRFIYRERPRRWPLSVLGSLGLAFHFGPKILQKSKLKPQPGETIAQWGQRCLGREAGRYLLAPALTGVYAGDPEKMSAELILGGMFSSQKSSPPSASQPRLKGTVAPEKGMGQMVEALRGWLEAKGVPVYTNQPQSLHINNPDQIQVIATSLHSAGRLLKDAGVDYGEKLLRCEMIPLVSITQFCEPESVSLKGFGCLFPHDQSFHSLGVLFNHCIFEGRTNVASQTWIMGGALCPDLIEASDEALLKKIQEDHYRLHGCKPQVLDSRITRWPKAIPHYDLRLQEVIAQMELPEGIYLIGNYVGRIGLAKIIERAHLFSQTLKDQYQS